MPVLSKRYERLYALQDQWQLKREDLFYAIEDGLLRVCVWLPLRYMEIGKIHNRKFIHETFETVEGFVGVRQEDCHIIFGKGRARLRRFLSIANQGTMLRLTDEPPQPTISVGFNDLIVLQQDRDAFESRWELDAAESVEKKSKPDLWHSSDYRHLILRKKEYRLGDNQAKIVEMLHDAAQSRNPWVHGKTLIYDAGVTAPRLRDAFKHREDWRELIVSDSKGYYRLNIPLQEFHQPPADGTPEGEGETDEQE